MNKRQRIPKGQSEMDNPETLGYTRRRKTKQKHHTVYVRHDYAQTNTNNVSKT